MAPDGPKRKGHDGIPPLEIFYWGLQDAIRGRQAAAGNGGKWAYTIWTPPLLVGWALGVSANVMSVLCVHACICKEPEPHSIHKAIHVLVWNSTCVRSTWRSKIRTRFKPRSGSWLVGKSRRNTGRQAREQLISCT